MTSPKKFRLSSFYRTTGGKLESTTIGRYATEDAALAESRELAARLARTGAWYVLSVSEDGRGIFEYRIGPASRTRAPGSVDEIDGRVAR